jgi:glucan phosphoethanolaminetransferase (alkaline phosphatase superfamily)
MQTSSEKYMALVLPAYVLAWMLPGILLLSFDFRAESGTKLLFAVAFFCIWHLAFKNFLQSVYWSLFFFFLLPFDLFFFHIYREPPGTAVLLSLGASNLREGADFMRGRALVLFGALAFSIGVWLLTVKAAQPGMGKHWQCYNKTLRRMARVALFLLGAFWLLFSTAPVIENFLIGAGLHRAAAGIETIDQKAAVPLAKLQAIFPIGRLVSMGEYYRENAFLEYAGESKARFRYNARQTDIPAKRQIYVFVIGETARADHFPLNGATRGQLSFLSGVENVIPLTNIVSQWTYTTLAVPAMLVPALPRSNGRREHAKSLVSAFREAGFKTYWISNQQAIGVGETAISHIAREADEAVFLNLSMRVMRRQGLYDEHLLAPMETFLRRKEPKQFFVLHLLGAHDAYEKRYPPEFDFFKPSLLSLSDPDHHDRSNKREAVNSYDNAIRYTDFVLAKLIDAVSKENAVAALIYSADHGETLFDGACHRSGHGSSGKQEFPVAAMAWVSNEYKQQWPARFMQLRAHASKPITTENLLPTALDLAAITTDHLDRSRSLASPRFTVHKRWVNAPGPLDWATAITRGSCNMLVCR